MILYTGGRYQGKLKAALADSGYTTDDVYDFTKINSREYAEVDYRQKKIWYHLEDYVRSLVIIGVEGAQIESMIKKIIENHKPEILVISETGAGVIPMDKPDVVFRETTGKISVYAAEKSDEVYRVTCGLKMKLK